MDMGYLIIWNGPTGSSLFAIVGGFNTNDAIGGFYSSHEHEGLDERLFRTLTRNISMEDAIAAHNALTPDFKIVEIYKLSEHLYSINEKEK